MEERKSNTFYAADNVDAAGVAWPTTGENIRNGKNGLKLDDETMQALVDFFYPVGYITVSDVPESVKKYSEWEVVISRSGNAGVVVSTNPTATRMPSIFIPTFDSTNPTDTATFNSLYPEGSTPSIAVRSICFQKRVR